MSWGSDTNANKFKKSYIQGFLDVSGGNLIVESSSQIQVMSDKYSGEAALLIKPDRFSVFTGQSSYDISYVTFAALGYLGASYEYTTADVYNRIQFIASSTLLGNRTLIGSDSSATDLVVYGDIETKPNGDFIGGKNLLLTGDASLNQKLYVASNVRMDADLSVNQNLYVTGRSQLNNDVSMNRNVDIGTGNNSVAINKDISANVALDVSGTTVFRGLVSVNQDVSFNQTLRVGTDLSVNRFLYVGNNTLFNTDVSVNQNLYVSGKAAFGRPPTSTAYELDVSGQQRIYETTGTRATATTGSLVFQHGDASGVSSIVFLSKNNEGGDYAYIQYEENLGGASERGLLTIGVENETGSNGSSDRMSLYAAGGSGFIGVNTKNPLFHLDVSGTTNLSNGPLLVSTDVSLNNKLFVAQDASLNKNVYIGQDLSVNRFLYVASRATVIGDASLNQNVKLGSGSNAIAVNKDISSGFAFDVSGATNIRNGPLFVSADVSFNSKLFVAQDASLNKNLYIGQDVSINRNLYVANRSLFSSDASFSQNLDIGSGNNSVAINKDISSNFALDVSGTTSLRGPLYTLSDVSINGKLSVGGDISFNGNLAIGTTVQTIGKGLKQPPAPMTANVTNIPGHGAYYAYTSSYGDTTPYFMFDNNDLTSYNSASGYLNPLGDPSINVWTLSDTISDVLSVAYPGFRFHIDLPYQINLTSFKYTTSTGRYPAQGTMLGSNNGTSWYNIYSFDLSGTYNNSTNQTGNITFENNLASNTSLYSKYALVIKSIACGSFPGNRFTIREIQLFGNNNILSTQGIGATSIGVSDNLTVGATSNLYGNVTIGSINNVYNRTGTARLLIMEPSGTVASATSGSLVLQHGDASGVSSIVFRSTNDVGSDYAYIQYQQNVEGVGITQKGLLTIGVENDSGSGTTADRMSLYAAGGSGFVGVNTKDPLFHLDISGTANVTSTLTTNAIDASNVASRMTIAQSQTTGNLDIGTNASRSGAINIGTANYSKTITVGGSSTGTTSLQGGTITISPASFLELGNNQGGVAITIGREQTNGTLDIGNFNTRTAPINIGTGSSAKTMSIGGAATTLQMYGVDASFAGNLKLGSGNKSVAINKEISTNFALDISGITNTRGPLFSLSDVSLSQKLFVQGDASFNQNLYIGQDVSINRLLYVNNAALFNGDISTNQNLYVAGKATFGRPPAATATYELDVSGQMRIYEEIGSNVTSNTSVATLTLEHADASGASSIMFKSPSTTSNGDYAYIKYQDLSGTTTSNAGLLTIGVENDPTVTTTKDMISLYAAGGSGYVGVNTLNPAFNLDVSGGFRTSGDASINVFNFYRSITGNPTLGINNTEMITLASNDVRFGNATTSGNMSLAGNQNTGSLYIGHVQTSGNLFIGSGNTDRTGVIVIGGPTNKNTIGNVSITGSTIDSSNNLLQFVPDASFGKNMFVSGDVSINTNLYIGQDVSINRNLYVASRTVLNNDVSINTNLDVSGNANVSNSLITNTINPSSAGSTLNIATTQTGGIINIATESTRTGDINIGNRAATNTIRLGNFDISNNAICGRAGLPTAVFSSYNLTGNLRIGESMTSGVHQYSFNTTSGSVQIAGRARESGTIEIGCGNNNALHTMSIGTGVSNAGKLNIANGALSTGSINILDGSGSTGTAIIGRNNAIQIVNSATTTVDVSATGLLTLRGSSLNVIGATLFNSDVSMNQNVELGAGNNSVAINKDISSNFALDVSGATNLRGVVSTLSDISVNGRLFTSGDVSLNQKLFVNSDASFNRNLSVGQDVSINRNLDISGTLRTRKIEPFDPTLTGGIVIGSTLVGPSGSVKIGTINADTYVDIGNTTINGGTFRFNQNGLITGNTSALSMSFADNIQTGNVSVGPSLTTGNLIIGSQSTVNHAGNISIGNASGRTGAIIIGGHNSSSTTYVNAGSVRVKDQGNGTFYVGRIPGDGTATDAVSVALAGGVNTTGSVRIMDGSGSTGTAIIGRNNAIRIVNSATTTVDVSATGLLTLRGSSLNVFGATLFNSDVSMNQNLDIGSGNNSVAINKDISSNFALDVSGATNLRGVVSSLSDISVNGRLFTSDDVSLNQKLFVQGDASLNRNLYIGQDVSINRFLYVANRTVLNSDASLNQNVKLGSGSNSIGINKDTNSAYALDISGTTNISNGPLFVSTDVSLNSKLFVNSDASLNRNLYIGQDVSINRFLYVANNALFNSDISANKNLYVAGKATFGRPPAGTSYELDVSGQMRIYELVGSDVSINTSVATLTLEHGDNSGCSSIMFKSPSTTSNGDYAYIKYQDFSGATTNAGLLTIGVEKDPTAPTTADKISLYAARGLGYVGVNTLNPAFNLDICGNTRTSGSLLTQTIDVIDPSLTLNIDSGATKRNFPSYICSGPRNGPAIVYINNSSSSSAPTVIGGGGTSSWNAGGHLYLSGGSTNITGLGGSTTTGEVNIAIGQTGGNLSIGTYISRSGNIFIGTGSSSTGIINIGKGNTISVNNATANSAITFNAIVNTVSDVSLNGNTRLGAGNNSVAINKDISSNFALDISGITNLRAPLYCMSDVSLSQKLFVTQDASFNKNLSIGQDISVNRSLFVTNRSLFSSDVSMTQNLDIGSGNNSVAINKDISANFALDISGETNMRGNLSLVGGSITVNGQPLTGSAGTSLTTQGVKVGTDTNYYVTVDKANFYNDPSLVIYYNFDTSVNGYVLNMAATGSTYDGSFNVSGLSTTTGMIDTTTKKFGGAASLKNNPNTPISNVGVTVPNASAIPIGTTMTFSMWVNKLGTPPLGELDRIFEYSNNTSSSGSENNSIALDISSTGVIVPVLTSDASSCFGTLTSPILSYNICDGSWNHIVWTITPSTSFIYINGSIKHYDSITSAVPTSARARAYIAFSQISVGTRDFSGNIDDYRYYSGKALNQAEIYQLYNNTFFNLDICGGFLANGSSVIYEPSGSRATANSGTLTLIHGDASGASSIMFKSVNDPLEYGYIQYEENSAGSTGYHYGLMTIGIENDAGAYATQPDRMSLFPSGGQGFVGINTKTPYYSLDVSGSFRVNNSVAINKDISAQFALDISGQTNVRGNISALIDVSINQNLLVGQDASINRFLYVANNSLFARDVSINGNTKLNNSVAINKDISSQFALDISGETNMRGTLSALLDVSINRNLLVGQDASINRFLYVANNSLFARDVSINGNTKLNNSVAINKDISSQFALDISGQTNVRGNISALFDVSINRNLLVGQDASINRFLYVANNSLFARDVSINGNTKLNNSVAINKDISSQYALDISGTMRILEGIGTSATTTAGSLILEHTAVGGTSSIMFKGPNTSTLDYAYVQYTDASNVVQSLLKYDLSASIPATLTGGATLASTGRSTNAISFLPTDNSLSWVSPAILSDPNSTNLASCLTFSQTNTLAASRARINYLSTTLPQSLASFTFSAWIRPTSLPGSSSGINWVIMDMTNGNSDGVVTINVNFSGLIAVLVGDDEANCLLSSSNIAINNWYHIAFVFDGNAKNGFLYLNKVLSTGLNGTGLVGKTLKTNSTLLLGMKYGWNTGVGTNSVYTNEQKFKGFIGNMALVNVFDRALTLTDIEYLFSTPTYNVLTNPDRGLLTIGVENERGTINNDRIVLWPGAGAGNVGINTKNPLATLDVSGTVQAVSYNAISDYRLKENVSPLDTLFNVDKLSPVTYTLKGSGKQDIGFIAHEVQELYPFLVNGVKDGPNTQSLNYNGFIGILTKEIKDLKAKVAEQEERLAVQEERITEQETRLQTIEKLLLNK